MLQKLRSIMPWMVVMTELSHVLCCVLPSVVTVMAVIVNLGLMTASPLFLNEIHDVIHDYEVPIILFSGLMMCVGWGVYYAAPRALCPDTGCEHYKNRSKKNRTLRILQIASLLFFFNVFVYLIIHKNVFGFESLMPVHHH